MSRVQSSLRSSTNATMHVSMSMSKNPRKNRSDFSTSAAVQSCGRRVTRNCASPQSNSEPKNMRSMTGEISGRTSWNKKMLGNAIQPSVPYFGRRSVSPCFQKDCSVPKVQRKRWRISWLAVSGASVQAMRSEEHTSELQSRGHLVCRLLLEKKKKKKKKKITLDEKTIYCHTLLS